MCGRFASILPAESLRAIFGTTNPPPNFGPDWNVAPTDPAPVIRQNPETGERHLDLLRWGLVPYFTKDLKAARKPINARSETAATSPTFRDALARRRCLVPAEAFYEWRAEAWGKQPHAIARAGGGPLALAGVWESWRIPDGGILRTFAILTTAANATMRALHERMPVVLEQAAWPTWLGADAAAAAALAQPAGDAVLRLWPVSSLVNKVANDGPELLLPATDPVPSAAPAVNPA